VSPLLTYVVRSDGVLAGRLRVWTAPRWFCTWMIAATRFGDGWGWAALAVLLAGLGDQGRAALPAGAAAAALASGTLVLLKRRIRRPRPCDEAPYASFRHIRPPDRFSFPSGHTMNACAIGTVVAVQFPAAAPAVAFLAGSIGASRAVLGMHYVSDVIAGFALGVLIGSFWAIVLL
jgi:undecaprenyl-diphosphatase